MSTNKWREENSEKVKQYKRDYYYRNKESHYQRNKISENKIKEFVKSQRKPCCICNESEMVCIDFHHLRDKDKEVTRLYKYGSLERVKKEIEKCVCLCSNCHRKYHAGIITADELMEATGLQNLV